MLAVRPQSHSLVSRRPLQQRRLPPSSRRPLKPLQCNASKPSQSNPRQKDNPVVIGLVTALTETLRLLGVGRDRYERVLDAPPPNPVPAPGDIGTVMERIKGDFRQGYIVTGIIDDSIYDKDTFFADPTVAFSGLKLWKRNLQLLVPFLIQPSVELRDIRRTTPPDSPAETLRSEWELKTYLKLPWKPLISILGATDYTLNKEGNQVVEHVESWNVSGAQALAQLFRPGNPAVELKKKP